MLWELRLLDTSFGGGAGLDAHQVRSLRSLFSIGVERAVMGNRCEIGRAAPGEEIRVRIAAGLPTAEDWFYQAQSVGRVVWPHRRAPADLLALALLLPDGEGPREQCLEALDLVDPWPAWRIQHRDNLVALLPEVRRLAGECPPEESVSRIAKRAAAAGRLARLAGDFREAETFLAAADVAARLWRDWEALASAGLNRGLLLRERDGSAALDRATAHLEAALSIATQHRLGGMRRKIIHDLAALAIDAKRLRQALPLVREAFAAYGPAHPLVPRLIHDLGHLWIEEGLFADAARVLAATLPRAADASTRGSILGNLGRAAGALGDSATFTACKAALRDLSAEMPVWEAGYALINMAEGAVSLGDHDSARALGMQALALGRQHQLTEVRKEARQWLRIARGRRHIEWLGLRQDEGAGAFAAEVERAFSTD